MLGLAELYIASGELAAAQTVLSEAVLRHSTSVATHSTLGTVFLELDNLAAAGSAFMAALQLNPLHRRAWCGLAVVFERKGNTEAADLAWREAFREAGPARSVYRGSNEPVRVLLLWSAVDGNVPLKPVLDDASFSGSRSSSSRTAKT
jgi:predicted Zn-dependent protease